MFVFVCIICTTGSQTKKQIMFIGNFIGPFDRIYFHRQPKDFVITFSILLKWAWGLRTWFGSVQFLCKTRNLWWKVNFRLPLKCQNFRDASGQICYPYPLTCLRCISCFCEDIDGRNQQREKRDLEHNLDKCAKIQLLQKSLEKLNL